ncbi:phosphotransferase [Streptomyces sp. NPDC047108]|uniref:phosphotransferase n=1 Tax=Streptomyces sp. NPDC047108 TaxID=3155025 RepID=UPI0033E69743
MTPTAASPSGPRKAAWLTADQEVEGPLKGYHHEAYAVPLPPASSLTGHFRRAKLREPRPGLLWFDRRSFGNETRLLVALAGRIQHIPVIDMSQGFPLHGFIEGSTLGTGHPVGTRVPSSYLAQLGRLFEQLVAVKPGDLTVEPGSGGERRLPDGDTTGFLRGLIRFTEHQVLRRHSAQYGELFSALGVPPDGLDRLRERATGLAHRPFCLLHGDLHRENFVVDADDRIWTIDWELAAIGDPLYDLATHLHLMGYPADQEAEAVACWRDALAASRPACLNGWENDLPLHLDFKRAQSVCTDVIRTAITLGARPLRADLRDAAERIAPVLAGAERALGMSRVPDAGEVEATFRAWSRTRAGDRTGSRTGAAGAAESGARPGGTGAAVTGSGGAQPASSSEATDSSTTSSAAAASEA